MESAIKIHVVLSFRYISLYFSSLCVYDIECKSQQFLIYKRVFFNADKYRSCHQKFFLSLNLIFLGGRGDRG